MKKKIRNALLLLMTASLLAFVPCTHAASVQDIATKGYVCANTMKVYQYPSILSKLLGTMSYGEDVYVLDWQDGWMRIRNHKGQIGFCQYGGLSRKDTNTLDMYGYVKETGAYVYSKPDSAYRIIASVPMGDRLKVVGMTRDQKWLRVQNGSRFGYVQTEMMSKTPLFFETAA